MENTDDHFQNLQLLNFDVINPNGKIDYNNLKQYQTCNHHEIMNYPPERREQSLSSIFCADRKDMFLKKETVLEHFNKPLNSVRRRRFIKKNKRSTLQGNLVILFFVIFFIFFVVNCIS